MHQHQQRYIVAGYKPWNRLTYDNMIVTIPGEWHFVAAREELTMELLERLQPDYLFFLHWSWKVAPEIIERFECVNFHMTDVPYGRGGSPLQNLIMRGIQETTLSAIRMTDEMDAGPVYLKEPLSLDGTAEKIYVRASDLAAGMIKRIVEERLVPVEQQGVPTYFTRRAPSESRIPAGLKPEGIYDFIRMLDAEGYPRAFVEEAGFRFEFSGPELNNGYIGATVKIILPSEEAR
jgi:methionyl-tRNA formyltransferase